MNQRFPLSKTEYGIFAWQMSSKNTAYNLPFTVRLGSEVSPDSLCEAIRVTVNAHPYLKTAFALDENGRIRRRIW